MHPSNENDVPSRKTNSDFAPENRPFDCPQKEVSDSNPSILAFPSLLVENKPNVAANFVYEKLLWVKR